MNKRKVLLLLLVLFTGAVALLSLQWRSNSQINKISVLGNTSIGRDEILSIARLKDTIVEPNEVNVETIQDRIAKHPEIKKVFVHIDQPSELVIEVIERRPVAILHGENEIRLVDEELETFPFKNADKMYDLPVISGVRFENKPGNIKKYNTDDMRLALFLILNAYKQSRSTYNNISEVSLSDTSKLIVYLSEDSCPFYFPRKFNGNISNKDYQDLIINRLVVFENYLKQHLDSHAENKINYVDLRYSNQVVVNSNIKK